MVGNKKGNVFTIKGKVHEVLPAVQVTDTFRTRVLIVEYAENPQYPEFLKCEALQDRCDLLDELTPGDHVEVTFNLKGRKVYDQHSRRTQYFNQFQIWRIMSVSQPYEPYEAAPMAATAPPVQGGGSVVVDQGAETPKYSAVEFSADPGDDDLPF